MISCKICSKIYTRIDDIVSTDCGHIFHRQCLTQVHQERWFSAFRTQECPQCFAEIKTLTGIKLHFEAGLSDKDVQITELKSTISHLYVSSKQLQDQLKTTEWKLQSVQSERDFKTKRLVDLDEKSFITNQKMSTLTNEVATKANEIQKLFGEKNYLIANCNSLRAQLTANEKKFINIQTQFNKNEKELNKAKKQIEELTTENKNLKKEITNKIQKHDQLIVEKNGIQEKYNNFEKELENLKEIYKCENADIPLMAFEEKIKVLTEKNTQLSLELSKEIRHTTALEIEKLKLENLLKQKNSKQQQNEELQENQISKANKPINPCNKVAPTTISTAKATTSTKSSDCSNNSLVIGNVDKTLPTDEKALKQYILKLAKLMNLSIVENEILQVTLLRTIRDRVKLIVNFKTSNLMKMFFTNSYKLNQHPGMKKLLVETFKNKNACDLYSYAKPLETFGFKEVFRKNNDIFIKKSNDSAPIKIIDRNHVNKLKNEAKNTKASKSQVAI